MNLFLDTEFTSLTKNGQLISMAILDENDREFYAEFNDYKKEDLSQWHKENVIANLLLDSDGTDQNRDEATWVKGNTEEIVNSLVEWLKIYQNEKIQFVADVTPYDWVFFCELFGGSLHLPSNISFIPFDISTLLMLNNFDPHIERESLISFPIETTNLKKHNALYDCMVMREIYCQYHRINW